MQKWFQETHYRSQKWDCMKTLKTHLSFIYIHLTRFCSRSKKANLNQIGMVSYTKECAVVWVGVGVMWDISFASVCEREREWKRERERESEWDRETEWTKSVWVRGWVWVCEQERNIVSKCVCMWRERERERERKLEWVCVCGMSLWLCLSVSLPLYHLLSLIFCLSLSFSLYIYVTSYNP